MEQFWLALAASPAAAFVRADPLLYPAANVVHVLALMVFFAAVAVMDLRLLGRLHAVPLTAVLTHGRRLSVSALALLAASGVVMTLADVSAIANNPLFLTKMALLAIGLGNVFVLERLLRDRPGADGPSDPSVPAAARACALFSLGLWLTVAALGRLIAYV